MLFKSISLEFPAKHSAIQNHIMSSKQYKGHILRPQAAMVVVSAKHCAIQNCVFFISSWREKIQRNVTFVGFTVKNSAIQNHDISFVHEEKKVIWIWHLYDWFCKKTVLFHWKCHICKSLNWNYTISSLHELMNNSVNWVKLTLQMPHWNDFVSLHDTYCLVNSVISVNVDHKHHI